MTGLAKYMVMIESNTPLNILLGQNIGGGIVKEMKEVTQELVPASYLAKVYNLSVDTVRRRLSLINQGTEGKCLYDPIKASQMLKETKHKPGRKRAN